VGCATLRSMARFGLQRRCSRVVRRTAARVLLVLTAVTLLLAVFRGGTRFFYCPMTHLAFESSPCASPPSPDGRTEAEEATDQAPAVRIADCCLEKWRAAAPTAAEAKLGGTGIAPAPLVAIVPPPRLDLSLAAAKLPFDLAREVRAGPPPPSQRQRRAQSMVFHL
jgi:hypothetical protein